LCRQKGKNNLPKGEKMRTPHTSTLSHIRQIPNTDLVLPPIGSDNPYSLWPEGKRPENDEEAATLIADHFPEIEKWFLNGQDNESAFMLHPHGKEKE
jgi:hypothetical protein